MVDCKTLSLSWSPKRDCYTSLQHTCLRGAINSASRDTAFLPSVCVRLAPACMAKGRRYGAERLLAAPPSFAGGGHAGPDLSEDEVWPAFHAAPSDGSAVALDDDRWARAGRSAAGIGRWVDRPVGGLSLAFEDAHQGGAGHQRRDRRPAEASASAPVDVPSWPRSLQTGSGGPPPDQEEDGEAGTDGEWLPPHEYLARAHGRSVATSVLEGVGRTLKGRDMSRVRDAVWNQTGFFG